MTEVKFSFTPEQLLGLANSTDMDKLHEGIECVCDMMQEAINKGASEDEAEVINKKYGKQLCDQLNALIRDSVYANYYANANTRPVLVAAAEDLEYDTTKIVIEDGNAVVNDHRKQRIDLLGLFKSSKTKLCGADPMWVHAADKLNFILTAKIGQDLGDPMWSPANLKTLEGAFFKSEIAKAYKYNTSNPTSNTQLTKTLQELIDKMIGDRGLKMTTHDVAFMLNAFGKRNKKACTIETPNLKGFCSILLEMCHHAVTERGYSISSKAVKLDENGAPKERKTKEAKKAEKAEKKATAKATAKRVTAKKVTEKKAAAE